MGERKSEVADALVEVRRAYRLLHAYHRRLNDLWSVTHEFLQTHGLDFYQWHPLNVARLPKRGRPFFTADRWAWDLMPGYMVACEWKGTRGSVHYKIDIHAVTDTTYEDSQGGEPDPSLFDPPESGCSEFRIGLYRTRAKKPDWSAGWKILETLANRQNGDIHRVSVAGHEYEHRAHYVDLADLADENAIKKNLLQPMKQWFDGA